MREQTWLTWVNFSTFPSGAAWLLASESRARGYFCTDPSSLLFGRHVLNFDLRMALLSYKNDLTIVAVIDIALNARKRPVPAKALAARHRLPPRLLEPVLQALVRHGILRGTRGPRGGYELARDRRRITADDILRAARTVEPGTESPSSE